VEKKKRARRFTGYIKIKSDPGGEVIFEDLAVSDYPGAIDNMDLVIRMIKEELDCLKKDEKLLDKLIKNGTKTFPRERIRIMIRTLRIGNEEAYRLATGGKEENEKKK
jgi:hypothetical protein